MPIKGKRFHPRALPEFWRSFREMDESRANQSGPRYPAEDLVPFVPRKLRPADSEGVGKLLVSHDFKGGYVENPFGKSYTFNWWFTTSIYNYFAHHRITIPPPEWITAAHRQGVIIQGTIIFEGGSEEDLLRMILGKLPGQNLNPDAKVDYTVPVSSYYAELFADLAKERGFDGWLLNVEVSLQGGPEQARALAAWITLLQQEMLKKVGPHSQVTWYDSVTVRGDLWWQDRLNALNLPFFLNSSGIFTNYWWYNDAPQRQFDYFHRIDPALTGLSAEGAKHNLRKTVQDIYVGVDVWGRGSHGGGGFGSYKAIEHIDPRGQGLSVALFAPGWTWETEEEKPGWNWAAFWDYDSKYWIGPPGGIDVPEHAIKPGELPCVHGPFEPISTFFGPLPPPDPLDLPFYTNFSPGIGDGWFVEGKEVFRSETGWTDMDKQTNVGDLLWPKPKIYNLPEGVLSTATLSSYLNFRDAWNGGNCVQTNLTVPGGAGTYGAYWIPIQTFTMTARRVYEATIVYKPGLAGKTVFDAAYELGIRSTTGQDVGTVISSQTTTDLALGWRKIWAKFEIVTPPSEGPNVIVPCAIGFIIGVSNVTTRESFEFPFLLGQLAVYPYLPPQYSEFKPSLLWMVFSPDGSSNSPLDGTLTWEVVAALARPAEFTIDDLESTETPWNLQPTKQEWFPQFLYFNVYAAEILAGGGHGPSYWLGTTGYDGEKKRFFVYDENLPPSESARRFTFQVEGVLENGENTHWSASPVSGSANAEAGGSAPEQQQKRTRRVSLKSVFSPLRRKKSTGDIAIAKSP